MSEKRTRRTSYQVLLSKAIAESRSLLLLRLEKLNVDLKTDKGFEVEPGVSIKTVKSIEEYRKDLYHIVRSFELLGEIPV